MFSSRIWPVVK